MQKRGSYFFVIDVFIGASILVLTLVIIFSSRVNSPAPDTTYRMAEDFMQFLSETEFRDVGIINKFNLTRGGFVTDTTQTLLQVIEELEYYQYRTGDSNNFLWSQQFIKDIIEGTIPPQYGINVSINGKEIYGPNLSIYYVAGVRPRANTARIILSARRIDYIKVPGPTGYKEPYQFAAELRMWT
jgi:hypothetical protein